MSMDFAINHMNQHHKEELKLLAEYVRKSGDIHEAILDGISQKGLEIRINGGEEKVLFPFTEDDHINDIKTLIIDKVRFVRSESSTPSKTMDLTEEMDLFRKQISSIIMSTINGFGTSNVSYSPYIERQGFFYIYISEVANHYDNMKHNPNLEIMFLEDESKAASLFLRKRLRYTATANFIDKSSEEFEAVADLFTEKFGNVVKTIRGFVDFHIVRLTVKEGVFVKGFGKAYSLKSQDSGEWLIEHISGIDHSTGANPYKK